MYSEMSEVSNVIWASDFKPQRYAYAIMTTLTILHPLFTIQLILKPYNWVAL